ncbi:hypothetical protein CRYUN_Cryun25bG0106600 [Craigia yunnanensis]
MYFLFFFIYIRTEFGKFGLWFQEVGLLQLHDQSKMLAWSKLIGRCTISCISVLLTQCALFLVPLFFSASPTLIQLTLFGLVLSQNIYETIQNLDSISLFYNSPFFALFAAISCFMDIVFNGEMIMLILGLCWIMLKDPGFVAQESFYSDELDESSVLGIQTHNEGSLLQMTVRYCKSCNTFVQGFDHHCPAFGNCIGQKNYVLFMVLLVGFITTETFYIFFSSQFASKFPVLEEIRLDTNFISVMARSTLLFSLLQVLWQLLFLIWHVYCICFNIRTEEWVNWKKYPEFQLNASSLPAVLPLGTVLPCGCNVSTFGLQHVPFGGQLEGGDYCESKILGA